ncbi:MAG: hypothetical protein HFH41_07060 [Lachnospiraceae bacterium]|nr:hypothetical protein [Lachnospiraceae bacterium]
MTRANLFTSNFKKYWKAILKVIAFLVILFLCNRLLWYLLVNDTSSYTRVTLHELYHQEKNVDVLFLGSSHTYRSLDPGITDEIFETNTFNGGTSSQAWDGSYALLVEAGKHHDLKKVYLEMYYDVAGENYKERTQMTQTYIISDYMKPSVNRVSYLLNASSWDYWINGFFPARRNWKKLFQRQYVSDLIAEKSQDSYKNYDYVGDPETEEEYYVGKGYVANIKTKENGNFAHDEPFESAERTFSEDDIRSLKKIIQYCKKHEIELVFFSAPMPDFRLAEIGNYDYYIQHVKEFLAEYDLPYYDFNLCRESYFSYDSSLFKDGDHLNAAGAEEFSKLFSEFFTGEISEEDLFYDSYEEKMNSIDDHFYGLFYHVENNEEGRKMTFDPIQNREFDYYASVSKKVKGADQYEEIQSLGTLQEVALPAEEEGKLMIRIFSDEEGKNMTNEIKISY